MELREEIFKSLVRKGQSERRDGRKVWDISDRGLLYVSDGLAESFLKLRAHPRYRATIINIEIELLEKMAFKFFEIVGDEPCNLIDLGCGDGKKAMAFIRKLRGKGNICYCPVSVNKGLVGLALKNIRGEKFVNVKNYKPILGDPHSLYDAVLISGCDEYKKNVVFLLGSLLAGFDIHEYLFELNNSMKKGDCLVIGNAVRKGDRFSNIENYKNPLFEEWFAHLPREMGFKDDEIVYDARFENGRVEGFYRIKADKKINYEGREFEFKAGDELVVAILYKYYAHELEKFCRMYFREVELIKDEDEEQALICCVK
ncbi:MAG: L-histidine N(alpha)-methyltransferase [archaeon]